MENFIYKETPTWIITRQRCLLTVPKLNIYHLQRQKQPQSIGQSHTIAALRMLFLIRPILTLLRSEATPALMAHRFCPKIYNLYKRREAVERFFRSYDGSLDFSSSYMRDSYKEEAWLFLNHLSAMMAFDILDEIYIKGKTSDISLKYFILTLERIHANRVQGKWYLARITKKGRPSLSCLSLISPLLLMS